MWIFTTSGFISAVQDPEDRTIIVRSRDKDSLVPISKLAKVGLQKTALADYPYRIEITPDQFVEWVASQARQINYSNFKSEVAIYRDVKFSRALSNVWSIMHDVEDPSARMKNEDL
jgi:hypothetical protein